MMEEESSDLDSTAQVASSKYEADDSTAQVASSGHEVSSEDPKPKRHPLPAKTVQGMRISSKKRKDPLNVDIVTTALEKLVSEKWMRIGHSLFRIPNQVLQSLNLEKYSSNKDRLRAAVSYWLRHDPLASWRRLIRRLDASANKDYCEVADDLRGNLEKQKDHTLTVTNVLSVLEGVHVSTVKRILQTPLKLQKTYFPDDSQCKKALVKYYLETEPIASWGNIAGQCLCDGIDSALQRVRTWLKPVQDPTLSVTKLMELLKDVNWMFLRSRLQIPSDVHDQIRAQNSDNQEAIAKACCEWYLHNHPAPSWEHVANALYDAREHEILALLRSQIPSLKGSKASREMFKKYMKLGHVESEIGKILVYGACGTGKSCFMDLMVGNAPKTERESTPVAQRPVVVFQLDTTGKKKWTKLSAEKRKELLAKVLMSLQSPEDSESEDEENSDTGDSHSQNTSLTPSEEELKVHAAPQDTKKPAQASSTTPDSKRNKLLQAVSECDDLVHLLQLCSSTGEAMTSYRKTLWIDSGGQPQFHHILPAFLRRLSLYVFVFKLSDELDGKPLVEYYCGGKSLGKTYQFESTNRQLLQHCLRTLHTRKFSENMPSKIIIVGTHRDMEAECTAEKREDKEEKLKKLLLPAFKNEVVRRRVSHSREFIFPLNAKNPESQDHALMEKIQHLVTTECTPQPAKVPLHYFALELVLEEASQKLGRRILSIKECLDAAAELQFDQHTLDLALQYLDELSLVFYFPDVLEGVLFVDPQVLLDKATELVKMMYQLQKGDLIVGEWQTFLDNAVFDLKFLSRPEFSEHYLPGLFTPFDLIKLFKKLLIFADFHDSQLFMPALLRTLKDEELAEYYAPADSPAVPLALDFSFGGPQLGVFCALSCFLVSSSNHFPHPWEIKMDPDDDTPVCLYRNCIRFSVPNCSGSVTLIDSFSHFEVHVRSRESCPAVYQAILSGLTTVHDTLEYQDCTTLLAYVCPCKKGVRHTATVANGKWVCKRDTDQTGEIDARYQVWENVKTRRSRQSKCYQGKEAPEMTDLIFIKNKDGKHFKLLSQIAVHWKRIAETLGLDDVEHIAAQNDNIDEKVRLVFQKWLENASELEWSHHFPLSWHGLEELLTDCDLAEISKHYFSILKTCT